MALAAGAAAGSGGETLTGDVERALNANSGVRQALEQLLLAASGEAPPAAAEVPAARRPPGASRERVSSALQQLCDQFKKLDEATERLQGQWAAKAAPSKSAAVLAADCSLDSGDEFQTLLEATSGATKTRELATACHMYLSNNLNRITLHTAIGVRGRVRLQQQSPVLHSTVEQQLRTVLPRYCGSDIQFFKPPSSPLVLQVTVGNVFLCFIVLRCLVAEAVTVLGLDEVASVSGDTSWRSLESMMRPSRHRVFRAVTDNVYSMIINWVPTPTPQQLIQSLVTLIKWLRSYQTLFTATCQRCQRYLNDGLPATWREVRSYEPYHDQCKS